MYNNTPVCYNRLYTRINYINIITYYTRLYVIIAHKYLYNAA